MSADKITVLNTLTGQVGVIRRALFDNPAINRGQLVEVPPGKKSYRRNTWKPRSAEKYLEQRGYTRLGDVYPVELPNEIKEED